MILDSRILWSMLKTQNVTVSVKRQPDNIFLLFQVGQIMDLGPSGQQIFLKGVAAPDNGQEQAVSRAKPALPARIAGLAVTYAGRPCQPLADVFETIISIRGRTCIEKIVPDVLAPGDFVLFKIEPGRQVKFVEALRAMTVKQLMMHKPAGIAHAL